mmetsp:Transcript_18974/g.22666  ORF Transcript_18974/g.22666 Transcript_18974/m.22666 type:complete len:126 (+) Transcript_18974:119-496(+)|eukprot:CAMPEP_0198270198 /NCGR_PEP_ID=MMETSP1447-20131203/44138_1 /TAXON_ID=420782 /ORGANISM="Chaetoceros dichaeta, Strain CCMP1751" /LENGTH=125 /DNA_ID=CAMNT_0043962109 /DNA_START=68 /DNA_END=445 /DNA_ORIENTATION=+
MMGNNRASALALYRSILRAHAKSLPDEMKALGDSYVKSEFKLHKTAKDEQRDRFFSEWQAYLVHVKETARAIESRSVGIADSHGDERVPPPVYNYGIDMQNDIEMTEEQKVQFEKLREEALKTGK